MSGNLTDSPRRPEMVAPVLPRLDQPMTYLETVRKHLGRLPERGFYPDGTPYYAAVCRACGDSYDFDCEQDALAFVDDHAKCWEDEDE